MKPSGISGKQCEPLVAFQVCDSASRLDPTAPDNSKCTIIQERQHESQPEEHNCAANILNNIPNAETPRLLDSNSPDKADDEWGPPLPQLTPPPVFENKYFRVVSSHTAGLGAIACRPLRRGDIILCEEPLFISDSQNVFSEFAKLSEEQKKVAMSLHANQLMKPGTSDVYAIWTTNCFAITEKLAGLFPVASRFNHACHPSHSVDYTFDDNKGCLILAVRAGEVEAGEELTISYGFGRTPELLYFWYGFRCSCGSCNGLSEEHATALHSQW